MKTQQGQHITNSVEHATKKQSTAAANQRTNSNSPSISSSSFKDNRSTAFIQRKIQLIADDSQLDQEFDPRQLTIQPKIKLKLLLETIDDASAEQILRWLGNYDKQYDTLYRAEAEDLREELDQMILDDVTFTFGFLRGPALVHRLRARSARTGPKPESPADNVLFGLDGKDLKAIKSALKVGYRQFDTAETYGNLSQLAQAIKDTGLPRESFHIVYKVEAKDEETVACRALEEAVSPFKYFDGVLIHNAKEPEKAIMATWIALRKFKEEGKTKKIGIGNFSLAEKEMLEKMGQIDIVEMEAFELLVSKDLVALVKNLGKEAPVDVLYYQIVQMAKSAKMDITPESIAGLLETVNAFFPQGTAVPILSSGSEENQKANLDAVNIEVDTDYNEMAKLAAPIEAGRVCLLNGPEVAMEPEAKEALHSLVSNANHYRQQWKQKSFQTAIQGDLPKLDSLLHKTIPERKGLKRVYVGRTIESVIKSLMGASSCDHKWSIELLQLFLMSNKEWDELGASLGNIV